jgi:uncharacterized membrane protein YphA (DoxX/SURF4 family)
VHGVERSFNLIIYFAKFLTIPAMIELFCRRKLPPWVAEWFVVVTTIVLVCLLILSDWAPKLSVIVGTYFLASTIVILLNVLFLTKNFGTPASNERTLLLFVINVVQIILAFAIFYRRQLGLRTGEALFEALRVFGTLGYPEGGRVHHRLSNYN